MRTSTDLARILGVDPIEFDDINERMSEVTGRSDVLERIIMENRKMVDSTLGVLDSTHKPASEVREVLRKTILKHEEQLMGFVDTLEGSNEFERAVTFAKQAATARRGFFLKKEFAEQILKKRKPDNVLKHMNVSSVDELLKKHDVTEVFSSLRFLESEKWMHETFEEAYSGFKASDFEERDIEVKVLGPAWQEVAEKFVAKKHHNVSHLKEFGVIFLNPIKMSIPGKFLRDTALFLHYFHEIEFYSKLFRRYLQQDDFSEKFKMLLRGDVRDVKKLEGNEWLIVQKYLWKTNPKDPRLFMPHVNPESMHWARGERDLTACCTAYAHIDVGLWYDLDWVASIFEENDGHGDDEHIISFDLEDNAMTLVSFVEGEAQSFTYHQREAMWTKIFSEYVGGEDEMERLLIEHFDTGIIKL
jgi:sulfur relay (sulfurtransferase) DsrF/TusC family protein